MEEPNSRTSPRPHKSGRFTHLITELRQRNVFRVAAAYAITGWLVIEVVNNVFPVFDFPRWTLQFVILLVFIGFPITLVITWLFELTPDGIRPAAQVEPSDSIRQQTGQKINYIITASLALLLGFVMLDQYVLSEAPTTAAVATSAATRVPVVSRISGEAMQNPVMRFTLPIGEGNDLYLGASLEGSGIRPISTSMALSPDGALLVYSARAADSDGNVVSRLYMRRLDEERAAVIPGSEGASIPFFSPDGSWIGYIAQQSLRRVPVAGGVTETIVADIGQGPHGAHWGDDNSIVYTSLNSGIYQVLASGGDPVLVAGEGAYLHYAQPHLLPGSRVLLFHRIPADDPALADIVALDLASNTLTSLLSGAMDPRYVGTGHLLFMREGTLMAVSFDPVQVKVLGEPLTVLQDVMQALATNFVGGSIGAGQVAVSNAGHLVYAQGGIFPERPVVVMRVSADGTSLPLEVEAGGHIGFRLSPDERTVAFQTRTSRGGRNLLLHDLVRGVTTTLATNGYRSIFPVWSPDGQSLMYASDRDGTLNVYVQALDGSGEPERLAPSDQSQFSSDWSSEGVIVFLNDFDIWIRPPGGEAVPFFTSEASETHVNFSPDGHWLVYRSDQSGRDEVYVRPYPSPGPATQISGNGGTSPLWSRDGRRIFFIEQEGSGPSVMMAVDVMPGTPFTAGRAETFISPWSYSNSGDVTGFDVFADGSFVADARLNALYADDDPTMLQEDKDLQVRELHIVLNFFGELQRRMQE